jgi:acylphosphatase
MASSYRFIVSGQVQGVGFRYSAMAQARRLGLTGWVSNRPDGSVEGLAAGAPGELDAFRAWLARGPPAARVRGVEWVETKEAPGGASFEIRRG